jgi:hypothetical protein
MKLLILFGLVLIGFAIYTFFTSGAVSVKQQPVIQSYQQQIIQQPQQIVENPASIQKERIVEQHNEPGQYDEYELKQKNADEQDTMRHPEYMFRPAPENNNINIAAESGSASMISQMQQYRPDFVQNGGEFMNDVIPASSMEDTNFSSFN